MSDESKADRVNNIEMNKDVPPISSENSEMDEPDAGELKRSDWIQVIGYFLGVLFFIGLFIYMIASGPKGALIGGVSLLAGALLWVVFRYVLKEIA